VGTESRLGEQENNVLHFLWYLLALLHPIEKVYGKLLFKKKKEFKVDSHPSKLYLVPFVPGPIGESCFFKLLSLC
jgi:hypothetical protein